MQLNHLHIKSNNVSESRTFYEKYFGFRVLFEHDGGGAFMIDEQNFLLALFPYKADEKPQDLPDWFHFGFCQGSAQIVHDLFARMQKDDVKFASELKEYDDGVAFYALDPGGNKVEVCWNKEEEHLYQASGKALTTQQK